jgi:hypothetical protein
MESYGDYDPGSSMTHMGTVTSDGGTYDIYSHQQVSDCYMSSENSSVLNQYVYRSTSPRSAARPPSTSSGRSVRASDPAVPSPHLTISMPGLLWAWIWGRSTIKLSRQRDMRVVDPRPSLFRRLVSQIGIGLGST